VAVPAKLAARPHRRAEDGAPPKLGGKRERTRKKILDAAFGLLGNEKGLTVRTTLRGGRSQPRAIS
jgi:hypothetical protein